MHQTPLKALHFCARQGSRWLRAAGYYIFFWWRSCSRKSRRLLLCSTLRLLSCSLRLFLKLLDLLCIDKCRSSRLSRLFGFLDLVAVAGSVLLWQDTLDRWRVGDISHYLHFNLTVAERSTNEHMLVSFNNRWVFERELLSIDKQALYWVKDQSVPVSVMCGVQVNMRLTYSCPFTSSSKSTPPMLFSMRSRTSRVNRKEIARLLCVIGVIDRKAGRESYFVPAGSAAAFCALSVLK